jgi:hypothetical protein
MRSALLGLLGLALGGLGALGYSHYLGEGKQLADLQGQLATTVASLTKANEETKTAKSESDALSAQVQQLSATNDKLKQQVASAAQTTATPAAFPINPFGGNMGGMVKEMMARESDAKFLLLKSRLHLTPEQETAVKAAMDEDSKRMEKMTSTMLAGGKIDPQAAAADFKNVKTLDQTLDEILTPEQKTEYQQMKTDEKTSAAETMASVELNQMVPALQLSDTQKDQAYSALAQVQLNAQDPNWIKNNMSGGSNPIAILDAQAKAKEDALAKILTPDQLATYHQQAQSQLEMQKEMMQKYMPAAGAAAGASPANPAPAPSSGQ